MGDERRKPFEWWDRLLEEHLPRIGLTPKERLAWAILTAQKDPGRMTEGDWGNLRFELALLCGLSLLGGQGGVAAKGGEIERPTREEAESILKDFRELMKKALRRESLRFKAGPRPAWDEVEWNEREGRFWEWKETPEGWIPSAHQALKKLIVDHGHMMKECVAPAPFGGERKCSRCFVANRPDQKYCSAKCQSRATTAETRKRAKRRGPAPALRRGKKGPKAGPPETYNS